MYKMERIDKQSRLDMIYDKIINYLTYKNYNLCMQIKKKLQIQNKTILKIMQTTFNDIVIFQKNNQLI